MQDHKKCITNLYLCIKHKLTLNHQSIIADIKNNKLAPIYFLYGEESHYIDQIIYAIENEILQESEKAFNQVALYGREVEFKQVVDHARQFPMMAERKVVLLKEAQFMRDFDKLLSYFEKPSTHTILAISYKKSIDKRKKVFKTLAKNSLFFESKKLYDNQVPGWIEQYVRSKGKKIHPKSAMIIASKTGVDLSKIVNEVDKLCLMVEEGGEIKGDLVYEQIGMSKDYNIFELQSAISNRNLHKALSIVKNFAENEKEHPLVRELASLTNYFQKVALAKAYQSLNDVEFARKVGLYSPKFARDFKIAANAYSYEEIQQFFNHLLQADKYSKGLGTSKMKTEDIWFDLIYRVVSKESVHIDI